jgi:hypothetical protein
MGVAVAVGTGVSVGGTGVAVGGTGVEVGKGVGPEQAASRKARALSMMAAWRRRCMGRILMHTPPEFTGGVGWENRLTPKVTKM